MRDEGEAKEGEEEEMRSDEVSRPSTRATSEAERTRDAP